MDAEIWAGVYQPILRRLPVAGDKWHLDEVLLMMAGVKHWFRCAVRTAWIAATLVG